MDSKHLGYVVVVGGGFEWYPALPAGLAGGVNVSPAVILVAFNYKKSFKMFDPA